MAGRSLRGPDPGKEPGLRRRRNPVGEHRLARVLYPCSPRHQCGPHDGAAARVTLLVACIRATGWTSLAPWLKTTICRWLIENAPLLRQLPGALRVAR